MFVLEILVAALMLTMVMLIYLANVFSQVSFYIN